MTFKLFLFDCDNFLSSGILVSLIWRFKSFFGSKEVSKNCFSDGFDSNFCIYIIIKGWHFLLCFYPICFWFNQTNSFLINSTENKYNLKVRKIEKRIVLSTKAQKKYYPESWNQSNIQINKAIEKEKSATILRNK